MKFMMIVDTVDRSLLACWCRVIPGIVQVSGSVCSTYTVRTDLLAATVSISIHVQVLLYYKLYLYLHKCDVLHYVPCTVYHKMQWVQKC